MQWSKLKSRVKALISPEFRNRIDFHVTSYRGSHDGADTVWITVDGERVFSCSHYPYERGEAEEYYKGLRGEELKNTLREKAIHKPADFGNAMHLYLDLPPGEALASPDPLVRAFAIVDRRMGKRGMKKLDELSMNHPLVKAFYELRRAISIPILNHNSSAEAQ
jgi:hypothetical protein